MSGGIVRAPLTEREINFRICKDAVLSLVYGGILILSYHERYKGTPITPFGLGVVVLLFLFFSWTLISLGIGIGLNYAIRLSKENS
jgi:hypothetical protein